MSRYQKNPDLNRVLVTGGAGYVGAHCCKALSEAGYLPVVVDNLSTGHESFVRWGPLVLADIRDEEALAQAFAAHNVCAVLHFAASDHEFEGMLRASWRVLKPGGMFFARLASSIGIEDQIQQIDGRRYRLPDGSDRYLVDAPMLLSLTSALGGELLDPIKTTVVENQRSMTTWVMRKVQ